MNTKNKVNFKTLGQVILEDISIQTLTLAIREHGIYTHDLVGLPCKARNEELQTVSDLLVAQYNYNKDYGAYVERTGTLLSPIEIFGEGPQSAEEAKDWVNPYDQFGWSADVLPNFETIYQSQIEAEPKPINNAKRKAPDAFVAAFVRLLVEIAKRDPDINIDEMPGTKKDLLAVASKFNAKLDCPASTFDSYIEGLCKFKRGSRPGTHYEKLFPEYFQTGEDLRVQT